HICYFFFFQAEDGIRDDLVTGVQTCALPIYQRGSNSPTRSRRANVPSMPSMKSAMPRQRNITSQRCATAARRARSASAAPLAVKIGRASCRERVGIAEGGGAVEEEDEYEVRA